MKHNLAIAFDSSMGEDDEKLPPVAKQYALDLFRLAEARGISLLRLFDEAGVAVGKPNDRPENELRNGKGRVPTALRLRRALQRRGIAAPPLVLDGEYDEPLSRWCRAGAILLNAYPSLFAALLEHAEGVTAELEASARAGELAQKLMTDLGRGPLTIAKTPRGNPLPKHGVAPEIVDRSPRYDGDNDTRKKGVVEPSRKPTVRPRR